MHQSAKNRHDPTSPVAVHENTKGQNFIFENVPIFAGLEQTFEGICQSFSILGKIDTKSRRSGPRVSIGPIGGPINTFQLKRTLI